MVFVRGVVVGIGMEMVEESKGGFVGRGCKGDP